MARPRTVDTDEFVAVKIPKRAVEKIRKLAGLTGTSVGAVVDRWADVYGDLEMVKVMREELKRVEKKA